MFSHDESIGLTAACSTWRPEFESCWLDGNRQTFPDSVLHIAMHCVRNLSIFKNIFFVHKNNTILWSFCSASLMRYFCQTSFDLNRFRLSFFKPPPWPPEKEYLNLYTSKSKWGYIYIHFLCICWISHFQDWSELENGE